MSSSDVGRRRPWRRETWLAIGLLAPAVVVVFGVVVYPILRAFWQSLFAIDSPMPGDYPFVGADNYTRVFDDPRFWPVLGRTLYFTVVSTVLELGLGLGIALVLNSGLRWPWLWRSLVVVPWALPTIVNAAMWRWLYNADYGPINQTLSAIGLPGDTQWLGDPFLALNAIIAADVWKNTSIVAFFILAGLATIPRELDEAAVMDGAGTWKRFVSVRLPLLLPSIAVVLILRTIEAFKVFDIVKVMTDGGPADGTTTIAVFTYKQGISNQLFGYGSALAYLIVLAVFTMALVYLRLLRQNMREL